MIEKTRAGISRNFLLLLGALVTLPCSTTSFSFGRGSTEDDSSKAGIMSGFLPSTNSQGPMSAFAKAIDDSITGISSFMKNDATVDADSDAFESTFEVDDEVESEIGSEWTRETDAKTIKWGHKSLTYRISKYPKSLDVASVDKEIARSFAVWSEYTDLTFTPKSGAVDVTISFESEKHCQRHLAEGLSPPVAHTSLLQPEFGTYVHFNDEKIWTVDSYAGLSLFKVAVQSFGRILGLGYSDVPSSVMFPGVKKHSFNFGLDETDVAKIQKLYGHKTGKEDPQICDDPQIDTIFDTPEGEVFVFKGEHCWMLSDYGTKPGYPRLVADIWKGLPSKIDAAFSLQGFTYFFKESMYWKYSKKQLQKDYPREIGRSFRGIPNDLDSVMMPRKESGNVLFLKGNKFWEYDRAGQKEPTKTPEVIPFSQWPGLPENLDAAFRYGDNIFFFQGDLYYRFKNKTSSFEIDPAGPYEIKSDWFGCLPERIEPRRNDWLISIRV